MKGRKGIARVGLLAVLATGIALAAPALARANGVTYWNGVATSTLVQVPGPGGGAPPALMVNLGMVQGAVYDAVNAIQRGHRPIFLKKKFHSTASLDAAVATAAQDVLASLVQDPRAGLSETTKDAMLATLATALDASLTPIADGPAKAEGIEAGAAAAEAMLAERANDGRFGPSPWVFIPTPGHWQPELTMPLLDPTPWGRERAAVLGEELVAVPDGGASGPEQRAVGDGVQRSQGARVGDQHGADAPADPEGAFLAERGWPGAAVESGRPPAGGTG